MDSVVVPSNSRVCLAPLGASAVRISEDSLFGRHQAVNAVETIPHIIEQLEASGVLANLRLANLPGHPHRGFSFADSDLHKTLEAIGWEIARTGTDAFDGFLQASLALLGEAQGDDGYLDSWGTSGESPGHWVDLAWGHELYVAGHFIQAAVALDRAGRPEFTPLARRLADLIVERFAEAGVPGHPEIETALVELYRQSGHRPYLDAARGFLERRGLEEPHVLPFGAAYFQEHLSPRLASDATGHAVRQLYLDAGCVDVAVETGDAELQAAVERRWASAHHKRSYVTGGLGSHFQDESFGDDHELPSERSYAETCAAIADVMLSWRLFLATGDAKYPAAIERASYNAIPGAVSADGRRFTYANPLQIRSNARTQEYNAGRQPWFSCACCPPNLARFRASFGCYLAAHDDHLLWLTQLVPGAYDLPPTLGEGSIVVSGDPELGEVTISLAGGLAPGAGVKIRIPNWSLGAEVDGAPLPQDVEWVTTSLGEPLRLALDARPFLLVADPRVDAVRGCVAVQAGPTVMCAEAHDDPEVDALGIDTGSTLTTAGGRVFGQGGVLESDDETLYHRLGTEPTGWRPVPLTLIPYRDWGERGRVAMRVWLARTSR